MNFLGGPLEKHRLLIIAQLTVLFNLFVIMEPLIYFRVCHGTPIINKN